VPGSGFGDIRAGCGRMFQVDRLALAKAQWPFIPSPVPRYVESADGSCLAVESDA